MKTGKQKHLYPKANFVVYTSWNISDSVMEILKFNERATITNFTGNHFLVKNLHFGIENWRK